MNFLCNDGSTKLHRHRLRTNQTEVEKKLWSRLRNRQCLGYRFHRQYSIGLYIIDFYCPKMRLAIELDGGQHAELGQSLYDVSRTTYLNSKGIFVLRFWNNEVIKNFNGVLEKILQILTDPRNPT